MNAFEDASRFLGVALILDKPQKRHHMNHLLYIDMRFSWKWYRFKHRRCPSPVRSIGSQMKVRVVRTLAVKFLSNKRSSLAILFLSGVKSASNCIKTCHRWIAKGLGDYSALRCCCLDAFRARAQKRAGLSYLLQETRALLRPLDLLIS